MTIPRSPWGWARFGGSVLAAYCVSSVFGVNNPFELLGAFAAALAFRFFWSRTIGPIDEDLGAR